MKRLPLLAVFVALASAIPAQAQSRFFEGKTIRIVVGFSAGGGYDTSRRKALEGDISIVLQMASKPLADLPNVPLALSLAKTDEARQLIQAGIVVPTAISRLYALPPGTPDDRVQTLRKAFLETLRDPELLADAGRGKLEIDPIGGEETERLVLELFKLDPSVAAKLKGVLR